MMTRPTDFRPTIIALVAVLTIVFPPLVIFTGLPLVLMFKGVRAQRAAHHAHAAAELEYALAKKTRALLR